MKIGSIVLPAGAGLAPMAGVSDMPFRLICFGEGAAWTVSEMLSAKGYLYMPKDSRPVTELLARSGAEGVTGLQLFGHEPELMAEAANQLEGRGFDFIDVNMGCPAKKIVSNGDGSALMKKPELAGQVLSAIVKRVHVPVTVKMRAGWDEWHLNDAQLCKIAEDAGVAAITLHGRTREQFYTGRVNLDAIAQAVRAVNIPVIGNGDVASGADARQMLSQTGCAGVAVGRGAQGNPWLFGEIKAALEGTEWTPPSFSQRVQMAIRHLSMEVAMRGEAGAVLEMRRHIAWYLSGEAGCAKLRARINALSQAEQVFSALRELQ
ncbi:MAG: tRNA dihydrouridine synthase DusB [Clostridia bacterium]